MHRNLPVPARSSAPSHLQPVRKQTYMLRAAAPLGGAMLLLGAVGALIPGATIPAALLVAGTSIVAAGIILARTRARRLILIRGNDDAVALLNSGHLRAACAQLDALASQSGEDPVLHALLVYNRAVASLRMGEPHEALPLLQGVADSRWLNNPGLPYRELLALALAQTHWALGDPATARAYLDTARETLSDARLGLVVAMEALLALAAHRPDEARQWLRRGRPAAEGVLVASQLRSLQVLEAFALTRMDPAHEAGDEVRRLLDAARPVQPWELVALRRAWPSFDTFCRVHGLEAPEEVG